jgi:ribonuclease HI
MKQVLLITDGACIGNPGPGGWACILRFNSCKGEMFGCEPRTTNNRMELRAVIEGLRALKEPCAVTVLTDSQYVQKGISSWIKGWKRNGWLTKERKPVVNRDLWMDLDQLRSQHQVVFAWVKGHADCADNLRCDELAVRAAKQQISSGGIRLKSAGGKRGATTGE